MMIEKIREYFLGCPLIDEESQINVDYLGIEAVEYTIDSVPADPILKQYVDGGALKQFVFVFGSREYYNAQVTQNIANSGFYQEFSEWVNNENKQGNLPDLSGGKEPIKIEVISQGYLFDASEDNARYQIQLRLTYYEDN